MKNLTVLHFSPIWLPQTQTWMYSQVKELQRLGVDAHVVCEKTENLGQFYVVNTHCFANESLLRQTWDKGLRRFHIRRHLQYLVSMGKKIGVQIVHSHFGHIGWENLEAVRKLGAKHVVTFYGLDVNQLPNKFPVWRQRYRELFESVDLILCEGPHMGRCIVALGCAPEKVRVNHLGVAVGSIEFRPREWRTGEPIRVLIAASFREKKGIPYALEALGLLQKEVTIELTIIGDAGSDPASQSEKNKILNALQRSGLAKNVRLLGYQSHEALLREAYKHHIFISPSVIAADGDTEGGAPVTLVEMAASGMPIISSTHCDIPEIIQHGVTGLLAAERDIFGLASQLKWLVEHPDEWSAMVLAGRLHIERFFDQRIQVNKIAEHYKAVLG